tara:strand:- start:2003 stop:2812 length:810 start_codon:yes stop_codon:yes gene_type:complete
MPIDVEKTSNTCSLTCKFNYSYGTSDLAVTNKSNYIVLSYDGETNVEFSGDSYKVQDIRIFKPSLNSYYGSKVDAELFIHHISVKGDNMLICIPIKENEASSSSKALFSKIIPFIPSKNEENRTININNYTLNHLIPKSSYYYYKGNLPYAPCNGEYNILLFDPKNAINMSSDNMNTLGSIIKPINTKLNNIDSDNLFYNEKGTIENELDGEDDIYIDCQPVEDGILDNNTQSNTNMIEMNAENLEIIGGIVGGIILLYIVITISKKVF